MKRKSKTPRTSDNALAATVLQAELRALRIELRTTVRAYGARLEIALAESVATVASYGKAADLSRSRLQEIRDLTIMLRKRKLKPDKGRKKDLRTIDLLINDLYRVTHAQSQHR